MAIALGATSANAQNPNYAPGDLVLFFQQTFGTKTVYANLGNAATLYRGTAAGPGAANRIDFLNINAEMVSAFGAGWATDPTIYAGLGINESHGDIRDNLGRPRPLAANPIPGGGEEKGKVIKDLIS